MEESQLKAILKNEVEEMISWAAYAEIEHEE